MEISKLREIMAALRDPETGCPWDREQTFSSIAPYTIEEAYEVADAIERGALTELADELGDLLLQVVYHARLAEEIGAFDFAAVVARICDKLIRRHPHVFAAGSVESAKQQSELWESQKHEERSAAGRAHVLDGVPRGLPGLSRAMKLGRRAARVGFDWPSLDGVRAKVGEELAEVDEAIRGGESAKIEAEIGDLLFAVANLCRHLDIDAEQSLRGANRRFESRFCHVEDRVTAGGADWSEQSPEALEAYWREAKDAE